MSVCSGDLAAAEAYRRVGNVAAIAISGSRLNATARMRQLASALGESVQLECYIASSSAEVTAIARRVAESAQTVVAIGGDGTVADVATGIFGSCAALGIIPAGSTNITSRSLGIPADPRDAIALIAGPKTLRRIDVGVSADRCFLHIAGAGIDAEIFRGTNPVWKRRLGWPAYLPAAAAALRLSPSHVNVSVDGSTITARSPLVLVANGGAAIAPTFKIHSEIEVDDGWLDVLVFTATTPAQVAATLGHLGSQRLDRSPHVIWSRATSVNIDADPPLAVELDGDIRGATPRAFGIVPAAMDVIAPPGHAANG